MVKNYMRLDTPEASDIRLYQTLYRRAMLGSETLHKMYRKRKVKGVESDALWEGYYSLKMDTERFMQRGMEQGLLLTMFCDW
ncbi:hypothetical protein D3C87_687370 [compost metagenome]